MNITYWVVVFALIAIAYFIIIPPLWKQRKIKGAYSDQRNINIAQERVKDLNNQLKAETLTQEQYKEQYDELELSLSDDLGIQKNTEIQSSQGRWVVPVIALLIPLISVPSYFVLGEPDALIKAQVKPATAKNKNTASDINTMVAGLVQRLKDDPNNADGWLMLGRSYKYLKKYPLAVNSFEKAYALSGDQPELMLHYADTLVLANGRFTDKSSELVFKALEKLPNNIPALWLAGMAKAEQKDVPQAMQYWRKLETLLQPGSGPYKQLQSLMAEALAETPALGEQKQSDSGAMPGINVEVSIAESIKSQIQPTDTVFIYAKALTGPPMPLAILKKQVSDLPLSVILNDAMAMMPAMKLSNFDQIKVVARISKSGSAMKQKGDFVGSIELPKRTDKSSVVIVIEQQIK
ncbi:MAG: c-type cytochrome biogenesis protein CcmI [Methylococcaceae bacterium]